MESLQAGAYVVDATLALARAEVRIGRVREGMALLEALGPERDTWVHDTDLALLIAGLVDCRLARGDLAEAMMLGDDLTPLLEADPLAAAVAHHARGELASALGDPELALGHFLLAGRLVPDPDLDLVPWPGGAALAHLRSGEPRVAVDLARHHVDLARLDARPHVLAYALRVLAVVDTGAGRVPTLLAARALLIDGSGGRLAAQIDTDLAGLVLLGPHTGDDIDALPLLRSAEVLAGRQELWPLQGRIRRLLDVLGETPRRLDGEAAAVLTAAERRVARLAISGLLNRQIALELGVSVKAVEWHLSHVYRKLAISSRAQLGATLGPAF